MVSYDMRKAYDRIQFFSLRPSLERFNMPEAFIKYVETIQTSLRACFKTYYGLTEEFLVDNSVRQGDPLAPLIFILFTDALHEGLRTSPIFTRLDDPIKTGYYFLHGRVSVSSIGFADDLIILAESWEDILAMHLWVLEFLETHGGDLNSSKTTYVISNVKSETDNRWLPNLDGTEAIYPKPSSTIFRYLGMYLSMDMSWSKQINLMSYSITEWGMAIIKSGISSLKAVDTFKIFLLPKLDLGLTFAQIDEKTRNSWSRRILKYIFRCDNRPMNLITKLSCEAFSDLTDCPLISERYWNNKLKELMYNLNTRWTGAGETTYARLQSLTGQDQIKNFNLYKIHLTRRYTRCRFANLIEYFRSKDVYMVCPPTGANRAAAHVTEIQKRIGNAKCIKIFTDGSTVKGNKNSGVGLYVTTETHSIKYSFAVTANGDNFHAEMVGLTIATWVGSKFSKCNIYSDSLSSLQMNQEYRSDRDWIRTPSRGWVKQYMSLLQFYPNISSTHILAHTKRLDELSLGNEEADKLAKAGCKLQGGETMTLDWQGVYLRFKGRILMSGIKKDLYGIMKYLRREKWKKLSRQGYILREFGSQYENITKQIRTMAVEKNQDKVWSFFILATLRWITSPPTENKLSKCNLCSENAEESLDHFFSCGALRHFHSHAEQILHQSLINLNINLCLMTDPIDWHTNKVLGDCRIGQMIKTKKVSTHCVSTLVRKRIEKFGIASFELGNFVNKLQEILVRATCRCYGNHTCQLRNCWSTPDDLMGILTEAFRLTTEGCADPLHVSTHCLNWISEDPDHKFFGAEIDFFSKDFSGTATYINPPRFGWRYIDNKKTHIVEATLRYFASFLKGEAPIRGIFLITEDDDHHLYKMAMQYGATPFLSIFRGEGLLYPPDDYLKEKQVLERFQGDIHFLIMQNKMAEAAWPISARLEENLEQWISNHNIRESKFYQRFSNGDWSRSEKTQNYYHYPLAIFNRTLPTLDQLEHFQARKIASHIWKINRNTEKKSIIFAGFFPRQFVGMVKNFRKSTYKLDIESLRWNLLEANCRTFEWYVNMKNIVFRNMEFIRKKKVNSKKCTDKAPNRKRENKDNTRTRRKRDRKFISIDGLHQDRKKKFRNQGVKF
jgi:ribonuclease HI